MRDWHTPATHFGPVLEGRLEAGCWRFPFPITAGGVSTRISRTRSGTVPSRFPSRSNDSPAPAITLRVKPNRGVRALVRRRGVPVNRLNIAVAKAAQGMN